MARHPNGGLLPYPPQPGGVLGPDAPQQEERRGPNLLDRILGLYGQDPLTHIPQDQRKAALGRGLQRGGMAAAQISGRGHDRPSIGQHVANFMGAMGGTGAEMGTANRKAQLQQVLQSGDPTQLQAMMMELIADGSPESIAAAKVIQSHLAAGGADGYTLGEGQRRFDANNIEVAHNPKPGSKFAGLTKLDRGDSIAFVDDSGKIVHSYRKQDANELRDDFLREGKEYQMIAERLGTIESAAVNPTAAGDLAMIFAYMKILDPTSVVRESEFANAANSAGVPERIRAQYNRLLNGQRLGPTQRADFLQRARIMGRDRASMFQATIQRYTGRANSMGVDPADVVHDPYESFDFSSVPYDRIPFRGGTVEGANEQYGQQGGSGNPDVPEL